MHRANASTTPKSAPDAAFDGNRAGFPADSLPPGVGGADRFAYRYEEEA
jgi:hypothetical protein